MAGSSSLLKVTVAEAAVLPMYIKPLGSTRQIPRTLHRLQLAWNNLVDVAIERCVQMLMLKSIEDVWTKVQCQVCQWP